ncbi:MAG TPA: diguanylate cyclase [Gemmatimonadaceae bacterium]|nr:diguanylate cyclase [Gemmatimonadaceae bacterium]
MASSAGETPGRVIVAEEDPFVSGALSWLLREQGYDVSPVSGRDELFAALTRVPPDLILLDGDVVQRDGAILGQLRSDNRFHDVRVIVTAPWAAIEDGGSGLPWGVDDCVSKPYRVPELLGRIRTQLRASGQLRAARAALKDTAAELERAREDAMSNRRLVDILHEVTGELSATEIYRILARRVARALEISHCSVVLARPGDLVGTVAAAHEDSSIHDVEIRLDQYPEITAALESERPVLVEDARLHPLFAGMRELWAQEGKSIDIRSVATIPFSIDRWRAGALFLRTDRSERSLTTEDVDFADVVIRAAVAAIRRAQALETTRADNRRLEALATTDPLTRVLNRRALLDRLTAEVDRARRFESALTLLLLDVDHFKQINDTAGHLAGDSVLRQLGALLEDAVRKVDVVARYGGEEFVVILPETSNDGATIFAERLRERIEGQAFDVSVDRPVHLTVSIGIATFPSPRITSTEDLFARADEALYRAKSGGRNQVRA